MRGVESNSHFHHLLQIGSCLSPQSFSLPHEEKAKEISHNNNVKILIPTYKVGYRKQKQNMRDRCNKDYIYSTLSIIDLQLKKLVLRIIHIYFLPQFIQIYHHKIQILHVNNLLLLSIQVLLGLLQIFLKIQYSTFQLYISNPFAYNKTKIKGTCQFGSNIMIFHFQMVTLYNKHFSMRKQDL